MGIKEEPEMDLYGTAEVKVEGFSHEPPQSSQVNLEETYNDDMVKEEEGIDAFPSNVSDQYLDVVENGRGKRPKYEHDDDPITCLEPSWVEETVDVVISKMSRCPKPRYVSCQINSLGCPLTCIPYHSGVTIFVNQCSPTSKFSLPPSYDPN